MNHKELKDYNQAQILEIEKYKWIESERCGYDIGSNRAALEWICKYSSKFRKNFSTHPKKA